jgi:hypothetical protein
MSGNKDDLVYKVADGIVLGRIPRCPKCFGGRPKFDFKKGTYYCSGYRDDEDFKNCHTTFALNDIKRDPWEWKKGWFDFSDHLFLWKIESNMCENKLKGSKRSQT